jgi:uncharacterized protein
MDNGIFPEHSLNKHDLVLFTILATVFSWIFWIPLYALGLDSTAIGYCIYYAGAAGPLFAAVELLLLGAGPAGVKELLNGALEWRRGIQWYIVALFLPLGVEFLVLFSVVLSGESLSISRSLIVNGPVLLGQVYFAVVTTLAFFGFLLPRALRRYNPIVASLLVAAIFIVWHVPSMLVDIGNGQGSYEFWWAIGNLGVFLIFTWLYHNTGRSLLPVMLLDLSLNYFVWLTRGVMQLAQVTEFWSLDFSLHVLVAIVIVLANWTYFTGKAPHIGKMSEAVPGA